MSAVADGGTAPGRPLTRRVWRLFFLLSSERKIKSSSFSSQLDPLPFQVRASHHSRPPRRLAAPSSLVRLRKGWRGAHQSGRSGLEVALLLLPLPPRPRPAASNAGPRRPPCTLVGKLANRKGQRCGAPGAAGGGVLSKSGSPSLAANGVRHARPVPTLRLATLPVAGALGGASQATVPASPGRGGLQRGVHRPPHDDELPLAKSVCSPLPSGGLPPPVAA